MHDQSEIDDAGDATVAKNTLPLPPSPMDSVREVARAATAFAPILLLTFFVFCVLFMLMPLSTQVSQCIVEG